MISIKFEKLLSLEEPYTGQGKVNTSF